VEAFLVSTMIVGPAEIGDKTQILSLMLAARFLRPLPIIFGILFATMANHALAGLGSPTVAICVLSPISARKKATRVEMKAPQRPIALSLPWYLSGNRAHNATLKKESPRIH
jgi:Uncharacterized protein family UPF0016